MRVVIEEDRSFRPSSESLSTQTPRSFAVMITDGKKREVIETFETPGNIAKGFLSETQAKIRAREFAERLESSLLGLGLISERPEKIAKSEAKPSSLRPKTTRQTALAAD